MLISDFQQLLTCFIQFPFAPSEECFMLVFEANVLLGFQGTLKAYRSYHRDWNNWSKPNPSLKIVLACQLLGKITSVSSNISKEAAKQRCSPWATSNCFKCDNFSSLPSWIFILFYHNAFRLWCLYDTFIPWSQISDFSVLSAC